MEQRAEMNSGTQVHGESGFRNTARRFASSIRGSGLWYRSIWNHDRVVTSLVRRLDGRLDDCRDVTVVIAATGHGNIGDQAMLESVLDNTAGEIVVIADSLDAAEIPDRAASRTTVVALPNLIDGYPWLRTRDVIRFARLTHACRSLYVIGADLMDGLYNPTGSITRSSCLRTAVDHGAQARVLGFSWSPDAHPSAIRALTDAGPRVECMTRDPLSTARLRACGVHDVRPVADTVFMLSGTEPYEPFDTWAQGLEAGRRVALVNMSALIGKRMDQTGEYRQILTELDRRGFAVVLVPHVIRDSGNDSDELSMLSTSDVPVDALVIRDLLSPRQVRHLAGSAHLVITGRMHLAIMSIAQAAVPITLGTQGKVEGLYQLLRVGKLEVDPVPGFGARVVELLASVDPQLDELRKRLTEDLPDIQEQAGLNFAPVSASTVARRKALAGE